MLGAFFFGAVPFGWLLGRLAGVDVRKAGSGNIGATNVARTAGRSLGALTLALDAAKGALPAALGLWLDGDRLGAGAGCAAVLGHVFSPFLGFRGGKGVATAAGVFAVLDPAALLIALTAFAFAFALARVVGVASVVGAGALAVAALGGGPEVSGLAGFFAVLVAARHGSNLASFLRHRRSGVHEPQVGSTSPGTSGPTAPADPRLR